MTRSQLITSLLRNNGLCFFNGKGEDECPIAHEVMNFKDGSCTVENLYEFAKAHSVIYEMGELIK